ncbi:MAG: MucB/RseB C-terminal domain-containing protein [Xanthomonadales bacterium]|jgi:sigma-E factor negative regulatory protein RseB|nr:MucB/RseB C-terminal domain-containing protein [Xanthomonadales bacterium]
MMGSRLLLAGALCLAALPATAQDQFEEVRDWLGRMAESMREQDYQGTFIYVRGDDVETIQMTHALVDGVLQERLVAVSGPPREIVRSGDRVSRSVHGPGEAEASPALTGTVFPEFSVEMLDRARDRYVFELAGGGRIAGHEGQKITITPRDGYRYGYELWLERQSALLLRWVLYDANRRALAKLMFTDLATGDAVDKSRLDGARDTPLVPVAAPAPSLAATSGAGELLTGMDLPPGFELAAHSRDPGAAGDQHLVFSDGLASVSIYIDQSRLDDVPDGLVRMGTTNAWSRRSDRHRVTAVGEVPPVTLKRFGMAFLKSPID